jgi:hypothetical protein
MPQYFGSMFRYLVLQIVSALFYVIMNTLINRVFWCSFMVGTFGTLALVHLQSGQFPEMLHLMKLIMVLDDMLSVYSFNNVPLIELVLVNSLISNDGKAYIDYMAWWCLFCNMFSSWLHN